MPRTLPQRRTPVKAEVLLGLAEAFRTFDGLCMLPAMQRVDLVGKWFASDWALRRTAVVDVGESYWVCETDESVGYVIFKGEPPGGWAPADRGEEPIE